MDLVVLDLFEYLLVDPVVVHRRETIFLHNPGKVHLQSRFDVLTLREFIENRDDPYSFVSEIVRTGIVAYEA